MQKINNSHYKPIFIHKILVLMSLLFEFQIITKILLHSLIILMH